jgi:hypothetical protein
VPPALNQIAKAVGVDLVYERYILVQVERMEKISRFSFVTNRQYWNASTQTQDRHVHACADSTIEFVDLA